MIGTHTTSKVPVLARALACAAGTLALVAVASASVEDAIDALDSETDECTLLIALCEGAQSSLDRADGTPAAADFLKTRQGLTADARVDEVRDAARAIERKRGRRLACFDDAACAGLVPKPARRTDPAVKSTAPPPRPR